MQSQVMETAFADIESYIGHTDDSLIESDQKAVTFANWIALHARRNALNSGSLKDRDYKQDVEILAHHLRQHYKLGWLGQVFDNHVRRKSGVRQFVASRWFRYRFTGDRQAEILAALTDRDKGEIAYRFGVGSYPSLKLPPEIFFQLYGIAPLGIDYEHRLVDYTTEKGFHVWINRGND
jgi:hypothetical protein